MKPRVLHILNELKASGAETMLASAAPVWLPHSHQAILSTGRDEGEYAAELRAAGYEILHVPFVKSPAFPRALIRAIRDYRPGVIHIHTERGYPLYALCARLQGGCGLRIHRTVHHLFLFNGLLRLRKLLERQICHWLLGVRFLSNSPSGQRNERQRYLMRNPIVPNWYDSNKYLRRTPGQYAAARTQLGFQADEFVIASIGGNWGYKNYDLALHAIALLPDREHVRYLQIGWQGRDAPLETLARKLGIGSSFRAMGFVEDPLPYLRAADAFLMPSSEEGFGCAAAEAMAVGVPAILSNRPALCDFALTVPGVTCTEVSAEAVSSALERLWRMPHDERWQQGQDQASAVAAHYGLGTGPLKMLALWRSGIPAAPHNENPPSGIA
jgi:glycosyltransferase involved in cell wall biosynthesis